MTLSAGLGSSADHGQAPHLGNAPGGVPDTVAFVSTVTEDVPGLHVRQGVLDPGTDAFVHRVQLLLPARKLAAALFAEQRVGTSVPSTISTVSGPWGLVTGSSTSNGARWSTTRPAACRYVRFVR